MNIINLIALIVVPILAVIIGQKLQDRAQKRNDKIQIFKILMMSRIYGWTTESVQAMNLIEIVFADDDTVCKQWKVYYDKLCVENPTETELQKIKRKMRSFWKRWQNRLDIRTLHWLPYKVLIFQKA